MTSFPIRELAPGEIPERLLEIPEPPKTLYLRGSLPPANHGFLAVVGARQYTEYGKEACTALIHGLRGYPVAIISGLALGIDSIAHRAAIDAGLPTLAVPGSGLDARVIYPSSNRSLADQILEAGGGLLSEFEPDFKATPWSFPQRNRIMAGLSHAVLIIEAEKKSGTLITSRLASDYNRDVLAVPGPIFSKTAEGPHMLLRLGATPISKSEDILEALSIPFEKPSIDPKEKYADCSSTERAVISLLITPKSRDELIQSLALPTPEATSLLMLMEIKGIIVERLGEIHLA